VIDWKPLAGALARAGLPTIGAALGGPAGGAIGAAVGGVVAEALGVPNTPEAVLEAARANPDAAAAAIRDHAAAVQEAAFKAQTDAMRIVNETYRAELASNHWLASHWRPISGLLLAMIWAVHGLAIGYHLFLGNFEIVRALAELTLFYAPLGAVAGVTAWGRTQEKIAGLQDSERRGR
jgi:hypothetical protein